MSLGNSDHRPGSDPEPVGDAPRRTYLANERTYLAWWRTGLTALASAVGVGRVVPSLTHQTRWPYTVIGAGFALVGIVTIVYGLVRQRAVHEALQRGTFEHPHERMLGLLTAVGLALGCGLLVLIVAQL